VNSSKTKYQKSAIAQRLWAEYLRSSVWTDTEEEAHAARCAIRCCAVRLNVYLEFCDQETKGASSELR